MGIRWPLVDIQRPKVGNPAKWAFEGPEMPPGGSKWLMDPLSSLKEAPIGLMEAPSSFLEAQSGLLEALNGLMEASKGLLEAPKDLLEALKEPSEGP